MNPASKALREANAKIEFMSKALVKPGECFTLPTGECVGNGCMHALRPTTPRETFTCYKCKKVFPRYPCDKGDFCAPCECRMWEATR